MKLITKKIEQELMKKPLAALSTPGFDYGTAICKFFHIGGMECYVLAGDKNGEEWKFYGYIWMFRAGLKYDCHFTIKQLESMCKGLGFTGIERDILFFNQKIPFENLP